MTDTAVLARPPRWRTWWARASSVAASLRPGKFSLRSRILLSFSIGALLLSTLLAAAAYGFTRTNLLEQRDKEGVDRAFRDAQVVENELRSGQASPRAIIDRLAELGVSRAAVIVSGVPSASSPRYSPAAIPQALVERVVMQGVPARMIADLADGPTLVIGVPMTSLQAAYFEFLPLNDVSDTLRSVWLSLLFGGLITTMLGAMLGVFAARRAVRPLGEAAQAAGAFASGRLDTRLVVTEDPDLRILANSFNDMAATLQAKVEREARFASDVSHELRSPLMTLAASAEVMQARRDEMPERARAALDLLVADVTRFQGLVEDLLEISRFDAGAIRLHLEELLVIEFVRQAVAVSSAPDTPIDSSPRTESLVIRGDRRRLARVIANFIDNARLHGGGGAEITVSVADGIADDEPANLVWIAVEDHGPGVPLEERSMVFERFARGAVAGRRSSSDGAGLGLALVDEHVRIHGGRVWVDDRLDGTSGARFVLELPAEEV